MRTANEIFTYNLNLYFAQSGKQQKDFAEYVGVSDSVVTHWLKGVKSPRLTKMDRICDYLHINVSDLFTDPDSAKPMPSYNERRLSGLYKSLNAAGQKRAMGYVQDLSEQSKYTNEA